MPSAPASISRRTSSRMASSWAGVGRPSSRPTTCSRIVPAPTKEATFGATPRRSRRRRYSASVVHGMSYWKSPCMARRRSFMGSLQGP